MMTFLKNLYCQNFTIKLLWWLGVVIPGVPFILISIGMIIFMHWPRDFHEILNLEINQNVQYVTLSAHGVKDSAESWSNPLQEVMANKSNKIFSTLNSAQISLNWQPFSDNALLCSVTGKNLGKALANKLAKYPQLQAVHLIGHSCGSFIIYGICQQLKSAKPTLHVQTTFLDPVSIYSGLFWSYGIKNFGSCADFSDTYIDTQDGVPGSNQLIEHSFTFDVTPLRTQYNKPYSPHNWPPHFYIEAYKNEEVPIAFNASEHFSRQFMRDKVNSYKVLQK